MGDGPGVSSHQTEIPVHHGAPFSPIGLDGKTPPNMGTFPNSWNKMPRPAGPGYTQPNNMRSCYDKGHMMGPDGRCWRIPDKTGTFPGPTPYQKEITGSKGTEAPKAETDKLPVQQEPREAAFAYGTVPYPQMGGAHVDPHGMFSPYSPGMMGMGMHMPESSAAGAGGKHGGKAMVGGMMGPPMMGMGGAGMGGLRGGMGGGAGMLGMMGMGGMAGGMHGGMHGMGHNPMFGGGTMMPASHVNGPAMNGMQSGSLYTMGGGLGLTGLNGGAGGMMGGIGFGGPQTINGSDTTGLSPNWLSTNNLQGPMNAHWWGQAAVHPPHMFQPIPELASLGSSWDLLAHNSNFKNSEIRLSPTHMGDSLHDKYGRPYIKAMQIASKLPYFPPAPIPNPYGALGENLEPYNLLTPAPFHAIPGDFPRIATFAQQGKVDPIAYQRDVANGQTPDGAPTWPPKYFKPTGAADPRGLEE
jgi:hypothetical protein